MKRYQVTLFLGRTDTLDVVADSMLDVKAIYENLSECDITMIKEYEYINPSPQKKSYTNFYRELKLLVGQTTSELNNFVVLRFVKPLLDRNRIISLSKQYLQIDNKRVDKVHNIILTN